MTWDTFLTLRGTKGIYLDYTFGRICNINAIYNIFPDGDSNPNPQNSSQADKYLTYMAVTDPISKECLICNNYKW